MFSILASEGSKLPGWGVWGSQLSMVCWLDNFHVTWLKKEEKMTVTCAQCPFSHDSVRINKRARAGGWRCQQSSKRAAAGGVCVCVLTEDSRGIRAAGLSPDPQPGWLLHPPSSSMPSLRPLAWFNTLSRLCAPFLSLYEPNSEANRKLHRKLGILRGSGDCCADRQQ